MKETQTQTAKKILAKEKVQGMQQKINSGSSWTQ